MTTLPPRVRAKHGRYYLLAQSTERSPAGKLRRRWIPLTRVRDGLAALYTAIAELHRADQHIAPMMPAIIAAWRRDELPRYAVTTRADYERMSARLTDSLQEFDVGQVRPVHIAQIIDAWRDKPRTANAYRALLSLVMAYAVRRGHIDRNPVAEVRGASERRRMRYITDDELAAIRAQCRPMIDALIGLALVTCQRIGDLLTLRWSDVRPEGIVFRPAKVRGSTAVAVPIRMTPALAAALEAARAASITGTTVRSMHVIHTSDAQSYTYSGAHSAWRRAVKAAGVPDAHFHDLRRRALTAAKRQGLDPRRLGGHSSEAMTQQYIEAAGLDWIDPPDPAATAPGVDTRRKA